MPIATQSYSGPSTFPELAEGAGGKRYGKYPAVVLNNNDNAGSGRLLVSLDNILPGVELWATPCVPYAGQDVGFFFLPPVGANVWVEFAGGDISRPIWAGCYWPEGGAPANTSEERVLVTPAGRITMSGGGGAPPVVSIAIGTTVIEVGDGTVTITASGSPTIDCDGASVALRSDGLVVT